ncbi:complex I subunit 5 family protein [Alkalibacter saccharofermentans]|uniref:Multisubunit sodium/proton antiporter, MrpD subunit n=1 Tax=Alkalibacter saccharofermentans DSM 14828 TaxID=1120975 RepID=A0A1M4YVP4_9FIRM|nr:proton-conducting transporter membrane subunit [Alkalibacter saccharofermentans]SHF09416.1 multisubunit sodium/proton antiporter, MrpD subunit [Alkalibacter saccharofermentans DSM 14828]
MVDLYWLILLPIIVGSFSIMLSQKIARKVMVLLQILMVALSFLSFYHVRTSGPVVQNIGGWTDYIGITLRADILASAMVLLTAGMFLGMVLFNLRKNYADNLYLFLFMALEGLIIGIFLSNDLFNIFVLIEVSTVVISILIMYKKDSGSIYDGILYLLINIVGMSFFLFGLGMLYKKVGVIDLYGIERIVSTLENPRIVILPYALIITAVSLKSALMPLFSWLPKAHGTPSAPSVISAILSGLYVKNGVYLFIRIQSAFATVVDTTDFFLLMGFITAVVGFVLALAQHDIKLILAYHTVSQIGLIMMGINMKGTHTYWGGIYHIMNHAVFKSTLFLTAGMITDDYKTRNIYKISGVMKRMPAVGYATLFAVMGITGAPLFNGSISKYLISYGAKGSWVEYALILVNLGTILSFVKYSQILFGKSPKPGRSDCDSLRKAVVLTMGAMCFVGGIFGRWIVMFMFDVTFEVDPLSYWIKILIFILSFLAGALIYFGVLKKNNFFTIVNTFELGFNGVCLSIAMFFTVVLGYVAIIM